MLPLQKLWQDELQKLWQDETGVVLSAEVVTVGTLGVLGAVVGLNAAGNAIDGELKEFASAIRSLDQSYTVAGHQSCRAWTAGSCYRQQDVETSLAEICGTSADAPKAPKEAAPLHDGRLPSLEGHPVTPNQIPMPTVKENDKQPTPPPAAETPRKRKKKNQDEE